jgi:pantoate kinase
MSSIESFKVRINDCTSIFLIHYVANSSVFLALALAFWLGFGFGKSGAMAFGRDFSEA